MEGKLREQFRLKLLEDEKFFSREGGLAREKSVVAAFLRCLGVSFLPSDLKRPPIDPPDVGFMDANFEVTIDMDNSRRLYDEMVLVPKARLECATSDADFLKISESEWEESTPLSILALIEAVKSRIQSKSERYGSSTKNHTDLLIYFNRSSHLYPLEPYVGTELDAFGFRSISVLLGHMAIILKGKIPSIEKSKGIYQFTGNSDEFWKPS